MKVALGTLEIDEDTRKKIGKSIAGSSYLKRDQAKEWALGLINDEIARIVGAAGTVTAAAPKEADALPEPAPATPASEPLFSHSGI